MPERDYVVTAPTRGEQTYIVHATSAREAEAIVRRGGGEAITHETTWEGQPRAVRDRPQGDLRSDRERRG